MGTYGTNFANMLLSSRNSSIALPESTFRRSVRPGSMLMLSEVSVSSTPSLTGRRSVCDRMWGRTNCPRHGEGSANPCAGGTAGRAVRGTWNRRSGGAALGERVAQAVRAGQLPVVQGKVPRRGESGTGATVLVTRGRRRDVRRPSGLAEGVKARNPWRTERAIHLWPAVPARVKQCRR